MVFNPLRPKNLTPDGWPVGSNPHMPGQRLDMPDGRKFYVGPKGEWYRTPEAADRAFAAHAPRLVEEKRSEKFRKV